MHITSDKSGNFVHACRGNYHIWVASCLLYILLMIQNNELQPMCSTIIYKQARIHAENYS